MAYSEKSVKDIEKIKESYEKRLTILLKQFEEEAGIVPFSGGLHITGIHVLVGHGSTRQYIIDLAF